MKPAGFGQQPVHGPAVAAAPQGEPADPPQAAAPEGGLQGGRPAPHRPDPGQAPPRRRPRRPPPRARPASSPEPRRSSRITVPCPTPPAARCPSLALVLVAGAGCAADVSPAVTRRRPPRSATRTCSTRSTSGPTTPRPIRREPARRAQPGHLPDGAGRPRSSSSASTSSCTTRSSRSWTSSSPTSSASRPCALLFQGDMPGPEQALAGFSEDYATDYVDDISPSSWRVEDALGEDGVPGLALRRLPRAPTSRSARATARWDADAAVGRRRREGPTQPAGAVDLPISSSAPRHGRAPARGRRRASGPAGPDLLTAGTLAAIERIPRRFLRTRRHPAAEAVAEATDFDAVYEAGGHVRRRVRRDRRGRARRRRSSGRGALPRARLARWWPSAPSSCSWPTPTLDVRCCRRCRSSTSRGPASASTRSPSACASSTGAASPSRPPVRSARCSSASATSPTCCPT